MSGSIGTATMAAGTVACAAGSAVTPFLFEGRPVFAALPLALVMGLPYALLGAAALVIVHPWLMRRGHTDPGSYLLAGLVIATPIALFLSGGSPAGLLEPGAGWASLVGGTMGALAFWYVRRPDEA